MHLTPQQALSKLAKLVGKEIWDFCMVCDMVIFYIGERIQVINRHGEEVEVGEYSLHIQCTWRIATDDKLIVGRRDMWYPEDESIDLDSFDYEKDTSILMANLRKLFYGDDSLPLIIKSVTTDTLGGFVLRMESGLALEVFPDMVSGGEHWRMLDDKEDIHYVMENQDGFSQS